MDKYKCVIWGTDLCDGKGARQELLAGINDSSAGAIYTKYKERGCENIFFLKYGIECGYSPHVREIKDDQFEVYNPQAGGMYRTKYVHFLHKNAFNKEEKQRLSGWVAKENLKGSIPSLYSQPNASIKDLVKQTGIIPDNPTVRADLLLTGLINLYPNVGQSISLNINKISHQKNNPVPFLYSLSYCSDSEEFQFLLFDILEKELKCIKTESPIVGGATDIKITSKGWNRFKETENKTPNENSKTVFVAMWIHTSMNTLKKSIQKAIRNSGYEPLRIDDKKHSNNTIDNEILSEIEKAKFVVCDITSSDVEKPRSSVYFEAGYARGKNKPVIWTCSGEMKEIHFKSFDTSHYKCLFWNENNMENFIKELQVHIEDDMDIGPGPLKIKR